MRNKLKVGLLLDGTDVEAWAYRMIEIIKASEYAEIALVVMQTPPPADERPAKSGSPVGNAVSAVLLSIETLLVGRRGLLQDASAERDWRELLSGIDTIRAPGTSDEIAAEELSAIESRNIDILIRLGARIPRGGILRAARYGVWSYHYGDIRVNKGGPAGYWEVMESWPVTGSVLQVLTEDGDGPVLCESLSSTHVHSLLDNRSQSRWNSLSFVPRTLRELYELGADEFFTRIRKRNDRLQFYDRPLYQSPTNRQRLALVWKKLLERIAVKFEEKFFLKQWILLFDTGDDISTSLWRFKRLVPPKDRMWADPFVVYRDGKYYVFIEELLYADPKGHISVLVLNKDGSFEPPRTILKTPYHLSYPFVFEHEGEYYMVPESNANRAVDLYKCVEFPYEWKFEKNLISDRIATDSTLFYEAGKWWLFATVVESSGTSSWDKLFLFYSDSPFSSDWKPHAANPVVNDVKSARPAGRVFKRNGHLYRPSQNSSRHYGYGFNICEITKLTETEYEEKIVSTVEPKWAKDIIASHTMNYDGGLTVIDGILRRWK